MKGYSFRSLTDLVLKIFKTKVNAGTGLSGGGSLEADRTLTVKYGTTAGTATQGNDSRLNNNREWTAATINQAEAEAGTETTRRAFTAQRVRQAIVAWWNSVTGVFGRDLVTSTNNSVARDKLGLFTSALRWPTWAEVTNKPTTFTPSSHTHPWSQVTGQPVTATRWPSLAEVTGTPANYPTTWNSVAAKPEQATRWPNTAEVTGLTTALAAKANTSTQVIAGTGLVGGGTIAANSTISISGGMIPSTATNLSSSDLNTVQTSGYYYQAGNVNATAARNYPSAQAGTLVVTKANGVVQEYTTFGADNRKYTRGFYISSWSAWKEVGAVPSWDAVTGKPTTATRWPTWAEVSDKPTIHTPIGVGQTWRQMIGSRVRGAIYTNTTGRAIVVGVYVRTSTSTSQIIVNDELAAYIPGSNTVVYVNAIVPPNGTYTIPSAAGHTTYGWIELR